MDKVEIVARTLHLVMGRGYCTLGKHDPKGTYLCQDHARAILDGLSGAIDVPEYPEKADITTLSARKETRARLEQAERRAQAKMRKDKQ